MGDTSRHITYFKVENFKRFESFEMKDLGQFNLIVGDNNVGKTSVLEALLFDGDRSTFLNNLFVALDYKNLKRNFIIEDIQLFCNRELILNKNIIAINYIWKSKLVPSTWPNESSEFKIAIEINRHSQTVNFEGNGLLGRTEPHSISFHSQGISNSNLQVPFVPFKFGYNEDLSQFYSRLQQNRTLKKYFIDSLKIIIPNIDNIELSSPYPDNPPHLIIYQNHINATLPLALFGEGAIKLFRLLAEILINAGGRLMIDEVDTGIHYSRFHDFWRTVLKAATQYNVQLFMTTHNEECIKYFVEVLSEDDMKEYQKDARSITLQELPDKSVKAYTFVYENLEANVINGNEVRGGF